MDEASLALAERLVSPSYIRQGGQALARRRKMVRARRRAARRPPHGLRAALRALVSRSAECGGAPPGEQVKALLSQRQLPREPWDDDTIEWLIQVMQFAQSPRTSTDLALMDSNNFVDNVGIGEREARCASELVRRRHYGLAHGIGRSGNIADEQPKAIDMEVLLAHEWCRVEEVAKLCHRYGVGHIINNAYGVQASSICESVTRAWRRGRVDGVIQSTDKNFMVPVGGAVLASGAKDASLVDAVNALYPGWRKLLEQRQTVFTHLHNGLAALAEEQGERLLSTPQNPISMAMSLSTLQSPSAGEQEHIGLGNQESAEAPEKGSLRPLSALAREDRGKSPAMDPPLQSSESELLGRAALELEDSKLEVEQEHTDPASAPPSARRLASNSCFSKARFASSYPAKFIAPSGAIQKKRGKAPLKSAGIPSFVAMALPVARSPMAIPGAAVIMRVLITSKGVVQTAAAPPDAPPTTIVSQGASSRSRSLRTICHQHAGHSILLYGAHKSFPDVRVQPCLEPLLQNFPRDGSSVEASQTELRKGADDIGKGERRCLHPISTEDAAEQTFRVSRGCMTQVDSPQARPPARADLRTLPAGIIVGGDMGTTVAASNQTMLRSTQMK
eukprot:SM000003S11229  [mRNA]  locus=s3:1602849:1608518:+ [translate_table: standard]